MREMIGEVGKKIPKKRWIIPHFYDVSWLIFETLCKVRMILIYKRGNFVYHNFGCALVNKEKKVRELKFYRKLLRLQYIIVIKY